ncbi:hypothetical protein VFPBJ_05249 [Purpureocillium lilacinum]|uniref:Uncharacterized protein n=1 Tax=Purpureocillium lilacinum TaxID=33203 RepID=A0A179GP50_PURLI|nr:hypothetical protein VFPBJ_05249 [Purpureocillium lilacinum]
MLSSPKLVGRKSTIQVDLCIPAGAVQCVRFEVTRRRVTAKHLGGYKLAGCVNAERARGGEAEAWSWPCALLLRLDAPHVCW